MYSPTYISIVPKMLYKFNVVPVNILKSFPGARPDNSNMHIKANMHKEESPKKATGLTIKHIIKTYYI